MKYLDYLVNIRMFKIALLKTAYMILDKYLNVSKNLYLSQTWLSGAELKFYFGMLSP